MKRLVLLGAGHAHLLVLRELARSPRSDIELVVITPSVWQYYSGMVPGWVAGLYVLDQCRINVAPLVAAAGGRLCLDRAVRLKASDRTVELHSGVVEGYDYLSIDTGSSTRMGTLTAFEGEQVPVKPIEAFCEQWQQVHPRLMSAPGGHIAVVGGGAGGVELALAIRESLKTTPADGKDFRVSLVAGDKGVLPEFNAGVRRRVRKQLSLAGITRVDARAEVWQGRLMTSAGQTIEADLVLAATGAKAASWLEGSGLTLDTEGFVSVTTCHQSLSHPEVFAAGDVCSRQDGRLSRSGVHAVRAGPILTHNLKAALDQRPLKPFNPRPYALYLLSCGQGSAIGSYGPLAFSGRWVWRLKDWIDRRFVEGFDQPA